MAIEIKTLEKYRQERETCKQNYERFAGEAMGINKMMVLYPPSWGNKKANREGDRIYREACALAEAELSKLKIYNNVIETLEQGEPHDN